MSQYEMFLPPAQYPTWHERSNVPLTPISMYDILNDEAESGTHGEFGHTFWGEYHPTFTSWMMGYVLLPGVKMHEVPGYIRRDAVIDMRDGSVFLKASVDSSMGAPAWSS